MARPDVERIRPIMPNLDELDAANFSVDYDEPTDTLSISLFGERRAGVTVPASRNACFRVDAETHAVIGLEVEQFLSEIAVRNPELVAAALRLGAVDTAMIARARRPGSAEDERRGLVENVVRELIPAIS